MKVLNRQRLRRMRRLRPGKVSDAFQDLQEEIAIMKKLNHPNGEISVIFQIFLG